MAKDFIDDSDYLAIGKRPEEVGMSRGDLLKKAGLLRSVKEYAEQSGGTIGSETLTKAIRSITQTIVDKVQTTIVSSTKAIVPSIESELFKIGELLKSSKEDDQSRALDMIETLQQRFGINLKNFSKELSVNLDKLVRITNERKEQRNQEKEILKEKIVESLKQQEILRQQGILTFINRETGKLQIKSFRDEKLEKEKLLQKEKQINEFKKRIIEEEKALRRGELSPQQGEQLAKNRVRLSKLESGLEKRKSAMGVTPENKMQTTGPIGETIGSVFSTMKQGLMQPVEMFRYFKGMGQEILSITNKFTGLNKVLNLFTSGMKFLGNGMKSIGSSIGSLLGFGGRGGVGSAAAGVARGAGSAAGGLGALASPGILGALAGIAGVGALGFGAKKLYDYNKSKDITPKETEKQNFADMYSPDATTPTSKNIIPLMERNQLQESLIKGSKEYMKEPTSNNNTLIAPNNTISNVNQSSPTVMNMEVSNFDRTFINLNAPSVSV